MTTRPYPAARFTRRSLLQAAAGTAALVALPAFAARAASAPARATRESASLAYWLGGAGANPAHVRAGWMPACASSRRHACAAPLNEELVDAQRVDGHAGSFKVRTIALANGANAAPIRLLAVHGDAAHETWSAWRGGCSSPVAARMVSIDGSPLTLELRDEHGVVRDVRLPARAGAYVLSLDARPAAWRALGFVAADATRPLARELVRRSDGARIAAPYLLLAVERTA